MERFETLTDLLRDNIAECNLIINEENPVELFNKISEIIKLSNDKYALSQLSNYDIFLTFLNCSNTDMFSYEETLSRVNEVKNIINNWTYDNTKKTFKLFVDKKGELTEEEGIRLLADLGLTPDFFSYRINGVLLIMNRFLEFKAEANNIYKGQSILLLKSTPQLSPAMKKQMLEKAFINCDMAGIINVLKKYKDSNIEEQKTRKQNAKKRLEIEEQILNKIYDKSIETMTEQIPEEWCIYLDLDIANELLLIILDNLQIEYKTEKTINRITNGIINKTPLTTYLYEHNINPNKIDESILEQLEKNPESINNIEFLLSLNIDPIQYTNVLLTFNTDIRNKLNMLIKNNILTTKTLKNNLDILDSSFKKIITNYEIVNELIPKLNYYNKFYDDNILLRDTNELLNNISIIKEYNLEEDYYTYLLCNPHMINIYDIILEKQLPNYILFLTGLTKNPLNTLKRIIIYKELDMPIIDKDGNLKRELYDERRAIIYDQDINDYLSNSVDDRIYIDINGDKIEDEKELLLIKELDKNFLSSKDTYKIGNTIISRPKVLKNLNKAIHNRLDIRKCLLPILISSSIYDEKEIYDIEKELKTKRLSIG